MVRERIGWRSVRTMRKALLTVLALAALGTAQASAQEYLMFPDTQDVRAEIIKKINAENVRLDISTWYLTEHAISLAILNRWNAGVPVRLIGDRVAIFEIDPLTRKEFEFLANAGIPIRLRYNPTSFPYIDHWKCGIFVGTGIVEFGSANWTPFELAPVSTTNFKDETAMFTDDQAMVNAFKTKFDQFWADTTYFLDWPDAYLKETKTVWNGTKPMVIDRTRLEPDYPSPSGMVWGQGNELNAPMTNAINAETNGVDIVIYRLTVPTITDALVNRVKAGVPVRGIIEWDQYRKITWPEYWLTGARVDQLWVAGAQLKQRAHDGLTHMKVLITTPSAMHGSSNFTKNWQRDHDYFIPASTKPALYQQLKDHFDKMWNDTVNFAPFYPKPPDAATLSLPANAATGVSTTPLLKWNRAPWAVYYDVYLGPSQTAMTFQGRVAAQLVEDPPLQYSYAVATALQPGTTYYWKVVSRTFATDVDPKLIATSATNYFTTSGTGGGTGSTPFGGTPVSLPGTVEAENFDEGGSDVAYFDTTAGNSGGKYRTTDVDIESSADAGAGYNVGWTGVGEWLKYTVNVPTAGTYDLDVRVAANGTGGTFHIEFNGVDKTGPMAIPNTGGWQKWVTLTKTGVSLNAGQQVMRLVIDSAAPTGVIGNFNYITVKNPSAPPPPPPPSASEIVIYAADVDPANVHGNWAPLSDATAAAGIKMASTDLSGATLSAPLASPIDYVDVTFNAVAGTKYRLWLRINAENDNKYNDSLFVQFSGAVNSAGSPIYRMGTTQGLIVNQATCSTCVPAGWGWLNNGYWLSDTGEIWFSTTGTQTLRIQIREDGVRWDQIVISPSTYLTTAPGPKTNDSTIVPKP